MKVSILALGLIMSISSFAADYNGITITGLPTASKTYSYKTDGSDVEKEKSSLSAACLKDKAAAEAFAQSNGFKIISSKGCKVSVHEYGGDMTPQAAEFNTSFEVLFK